MSSPICLLSTSNSSIFVTLSLYRSCFVYNKILIHFLQLAAFSAFSVESCLTTVNCGWGNIIHFYNPISSLQYCCFATKISSHFTPVHQQNIQSIGFPQLPMAMPSDCSWFRAYQYIELTLSYSFMIPGVGWIKMNHTVMEVIPPISWTMNQLLFFS